MSVYCPSMIFVSVYAGRLETRMMHPRSFVCRSHKVPVKSPGLVPPRVRRSSEQLWAKRRWVADPRRQENYQGQRQRYEGLKDIEGKHCVYMICTKKVVKVKGFQL